MNVLLGRPGRLWQPLMAGIKAAYQAGQEVILLVPEQMTLQAERDCLSALEVKGFFRLQVLSPSRLKSRVLERAGRDARTLIDQRGKLLTVARALKKTQKGLKYYSAAREKAGFAQKMTEAISELKGAGIRPVDLLAYAQNQQMEDAKLSDLALLYEAYEQLLEGKLLDAQDEDGEFLSRLATSRLYADTAFFVHGFDLISQPMIRLLPVIACQARQVTLSLVTGHPEDLDYEAFDPVISSLKHLEEAMAASGFAVKRTWVQKSPETKPAALTALEARLLQIKAPAFLDQPEGLRLYAARTPYEELRQAAKHIKREQERGVQPGDIALILCDEAGYAPLVPAVLSDYGIPFHLSTKEPILAHSLVRCLLSSLMMIRDAAWRQEDVFSYIKSPFSPLSKQESWVLENWALRYGIHGSRFTRPFTKGEDGKREEAEELRKKAFDPVITLKEGLVKARTASQSLRAVIGFLEAINAHQNIVALEDQLNLAGMPEEAIRTRQVWDKLCELFEQMDELLSEERIPLNQFPDWLHTALSQTELASLPPQEDCVQAGPLGQLMPHNARVVLVCGLNAGTLNLSDEALLSDQERLGLEKQLKARLNLPLTQREEIKELDLWKALSAARERLYLSYALSDEQGGALGPLPEINRIKQIFPLLLEEGGAIAPQLEETPLSPAQALDEIALRLREGGLSGPFLDAFWVLQNDPEQRPLLEAVLRSAQGDSPDKQLSQPTAKRLFPRGVVSVSRLETYAKCPFMHFVDYGLSPMERQVWEIRNTEWGTFYHEAMEGFVRSVKQHASWPKIDRAQSDQIMDQTLQELTAGWEDMPYADSQRAKKAAQDAQEVCKNLAWNLTLGSQESAFVPLATELTFGMGGELPPIEIELPEGGNLLLRGKIDRVDIALDQGMRFVRVVDYKTGTTQLNAADLNTGAQLQLLLYLKAVLDLYDDALAAGAFNQQLADPIINQNDPRKAERARQNRQRLQGVFLKDEGVLRLMDKASPPRTIADFHTRSGLAVNDRLLSREELDRLLALAEQRAVELSFQIFSGKITRSPLIGTDRLAPCRYCQYAGICRLSELSNEKRRRLTRQTSFHRLAHDMAKMAP